jgi:molecular chaperone HscB
MVQCPSCARQVESSLTCPQCGSPIGADLDLFAALGLPRDLQIDTARLERVYHDLGRRIHPDRFASSPVKQRDASLRATALLTRAYRTLRDPFSRGLYALELNGIKLAENNKAVPPDLAELVFEVQEQLADLNAARRQSDDAARDLDTAVAARRCELQDKLNALMDDLNALFGRIDLTDGSARDALLGDLKMVLSNIAYMRTLLRDVAKELDLTHAA